MAKWPWKYYEELYDDIEELRVIIRWAVERPATEARINKLFDRLEANPLWPLFLEETGMSSWYLDRADLIELTKAMRKQSAAVGRIASKIERMVYPNMPKSGHRIFGSEKERKRWTTSAPYEE